MRATWRCVDPPALPWDRADGRAATAHADTTLRLVPNGSRLRLRYVAYYDRGVVAAVRYRRIETVPPSIRHASAEVSGAAR